MARQTAKIVLDTSRLERDTRQLAAALKTGGEHEAHQQASRTAEKVRTQTPVRTGVLRSTVTVVPAWVDATRRSPGGNGWGVTYGAGLPYAGYIERLRHPVRKGCRGSRTEFKRALSELAGQAVHRI